jgi:DNA processing protein
VQPADLLGPQQHSIMTALSSIIDLDRLRELLDRGLLLSHAIEQWESRGIWVISRADSRYPKRLKAKLKQFAPPLLFGCGDIELLEQGGLCIVGSRKVDDAISDFVADTARLAANSGLNVISGGARGVDQIAMRAALAVEGTVVGALAENLSRAVIDPEYRQALKARSMTLISAVDPNAGFNVGNAMARNKLIYALADIGLVANADFEKGGTWAGAVEQLERFKCCPVFVRTAAPTPKGNKALIDRGAQPWPSPADSSAFRALMTGKATVSTGNAAAALELDFAAPRSRGANEPAKVSDHDQRGGSEQVAEDAADNPSRPQSVEPAATVACPAKRMAAAAHAAILDLLANEALSDAEVADALGIERGQAKVWLQQLVKDGKIQQTKRPIRYGRNTQQQTLFS